MKPKGKLFALFAIFAAIGLVTATGAFTTVQAERTMNVNVAGDANALLRLEPADTGSYANGHYAMQNGNQLSINITANNAPTGGGEGINENALTRMHNVFVIENQGTQDVGVYIDNPNSEVVFYNATSPTDSLEGSTNSTTLTPGDTIYVGFEIDLRGTGISNLNLQDITVVADADEAV